MLKRSFVLREYLAPVVLYSCAAVMCILMVTVPGCLGGNKRETTLKAALATVQTSRTLFEQWDAKKQLAIVDAATSRDQAEKEIAAYRDHRNEVVAAFLDAVVLIATAATQSDDLSLASAKKALTRLVGDLKTLGVPGV